MKIEKLKPLCPGDRASSLSSRKKDKEELVLIRRFVILCNNLQEIISDCNCNLSSAQTRSCLSMDYLQALSVIEERLPKLKTIFLLDADQVSDKIKEFLNHIPSSVLVVAVSNHLLKQKDYPWLLYVKTLTLSKGASDIVITSFIARLCGRVEKICLVSGDHFIEEVREMCKLEGQSCYLPHPRHHLGLWYTLKFTERKEEQVEQFISFASDYLKLFSKEEAFTMAYFKKNWKKPSFSVPEYVDLRLEFSSRWKGSAEEFCEKFSLRHNRFLAWLHYRNLNNSYVEEAIKKWLLE